MQTVVITGGSAGIGRAVAEIYARRGCRIGLIARGEERLQDAVLALQDLGSPGVAAAAADVSEAAHLEATADRFEQELGPIEVWINAAMTTVYSPFVEMSAAEFERVTRVVYLGAVNGTRAALERMRPRRRGAIVNVGSGLAYRAIPLQSAYCGAKFAIRGFTEAIRSELIHDDLRISLSQVHLPGVNTPQFDWARNRMARKPQPAPPIYEPEVAARAIVEAADEGVRELFVGTSTLKVLVGNMVAPGMLDRMLAASAYDAQQSEQHEPGGRPDNLFAPLPGHQGAHGRFGDRAREQGVVVSSAALRGGAIAAGAVAFLVAGMVLGALSRGQQPARRRRDGPRPAGQSRRTVKALKHSGADQLGGSGTPWH
jgi:short-subunit dehydrogenase